MQPESAKRPKTHSSDAASDAPPGVWRAKRYAVKFNPPCIYLEYEDTALKKRVRQVKLTRVPADVDVDRLTRKVIRSFPRQLDPTSVKHDQVRKLVVKLLQSMQQSQGAAAGQQQQQQQGGTAAARPATSPALKSLNLEPSPGPSSLTTPRLLPCLSPSIPPTPADVLSGGTRPLSGQSAESIDRFSTSTLGGTTRGSQVASREEEDPLDDLDDVLNELNREMGGGSGPSSGGSRPGSGALADLSRNGSYNSMKAHGSVTSVLSLDCDSTGGSGHSAGSHGPANGHANVRGSAPAGPSASKSRFAPGAETECLVLDVDIEGEVNLNKVTDMELALAKKKMEQAFLKNQLKPGDPGFEYDKQVEFAPATEANDWDESGDEEEEEEEPQRPAAAQQQQQPQPSTIPAAAAAASKGAAGTTAAGGAGGATASGPGGLRVQVGPQEEDDDDHYTMSHEVSATSPESCIDEVSPNKVAIDTDSDLEGGLELP